MFSLPGFGLGWDKRAKIAAALIVAAAYFGVAYWTKTIYRSDPNFTVGPSVAGDKVLLLKPFTKRNGFAFATERPLFFDSVADTSEDPQGSPVQLFENNTRLGPADSSYGVIAGSGGGRFGLLKDENRTTIVFSTSDNTDPNTNGRAYWLVKPRHPVASVQD